MYTKCMMHIHGGGFISMSSSSHQMYSRAWSKDLDLPIFSIDYRLAPEHPYPNGLQDCFDLYSFLLQYLNQTDQKLFSNLDLKHIILAGDSAGGNLAFGLTIKSIQHSLPLPHALFIQYPVLKLAYQFNYSKFYTLDDLQQVDFHNEKTPFPKSGEEKSVWDKHEKTEKNNARKT